MIDWLMSQQLAASTLILVLIACQQTLIARLGAAWCYRLWLLLPLGLIAFNLPGHLKPAATPELQRFLVLPGQQIETYFYYIDWPTLYLVGAGLVLLLLASSHIRFSQVLNPEPVSDPQVRKLSRSPLYVSHAVSSPMLTGVFRPKLVLPANAAQIYTPQELDLIIRHEEFHLKRGDNLINLIALFGVTLFWFNPLTWLGYSKFRQLQELSCDQGVLHGQNEAKRIIYARALVQCAAASRMPLYAYSHYGAKETMLNRLKLIKTAPTGNKVLSGLTLAGALGLISTLAVAQMPAPGIEKQKSVHPLTRVEPKYPVEAAQQKITGAVILKFDIAADGSTGNIEVVKAIPENTFNKVSIAALSQWRYSASPNGLKDQLVQLDFLMDDNQKAPQFERIEVRKHN